MLLIDLNMYWTFIVTPFFPPLTALASSLQYHFVNESKSWTEAQRYCRQNYTDLATIDNMEEINRLINTVNGSYNGSAWIGQYDDVNSWRWSLEDNDFYQEGERDFRNWYHEPDNRANELCVYMNYNGNWFDYSCDNYISFVCYNGKTSQVIYFSYEVNDHKFFSNCLPHLNPKFLGEHKYFSFFHLLVIFFL